jgi:hypothetical protein
MTEGSPSGSGTPGEVTDPPARSAESAASEGVRERVRDAGRPAEIIDGRLGRSLDDLRDDDGDIQVSRREAMAYGAGAGAGLGGWKALHNVVLGYGVLAGTNLTEQDLPTLTSEHFGEHGGVATIGDYELRADSDSVGLYDDGERVDGLTFAGGANGATAAERIDADYGLDSEPFAQVRADLGDLADGSASFEFATTGAFLDRVEAADARPVTVKLLRGPVFDSPEADFVADFADAHPSDAGALIGGLKGGFREYSYYDIPRYAAGSVEDNILLGAVDLRQYFESPTDFEALAAGENSGLFCTELVNRSIEAFHAVPATEQSPPIVAGCVYDERHKHSYTILASAIREDGELVIPATFVDYTHSTLYDDLHVRWLLGDGLEAYNDRHRATEIFWNSYASI